MRAWEVERSVGGCVLFLSVADLDQLLHIQKLSTASSLLVPQISVHHLFPKEIW